MCDRNFFCIFVKYLVRNKEIIKTSGFLLWIIEITVIDLSNHEFNPVVQFRPAQF